MKRVIRLINNFEPDSGSYLSRVSREAWLLRERLKQSTIRVRVADNLLSEQGAKDKLGS